MYIIEQKAIDMSIEEFKKWDIPQGWDIVRMSGEETVKPGPYYVGSSREMIFNIHVVIQKGKYE